MMKIIFAGTATFAVPSLQKLIEASLMASEHQLLAVYTQPDRPQGRGQKPGQSPVKQLANFHHIPIYQPSNLREPKAYQALETLQPDLLVVVAYGLLLPPEVLSIPRLGALNVHGSLLPRWRGAAPVQRALLSGDTSTGITIMQMDAGLDTGPILMQVTENILPTDTTDSLQQRLAKLGADALLSTLQDLPKKQANLYPQPESDSTYAAKIKKEEAMIQWDKPAETLERSIRAFNPWPISYTLLNGKRIRIWNAVLYQSNALPSLSPGTIASITKEEIIVATGKDYLALRELQLESGRRLPVSHLLNGQLANLSVGMRFEMSV